MRKAIFAAALVLVSVFLFSTLYAQEEADRKLVPEAMVSIGTPFPERAAAQSSVNRLRSQMSKELTAHLEALLKAEDRSLAGPLQTTLGVIGEWRFEEMVPQLLPIIDLQLDPLTAPAFLKLAPSACYPVADALGKIGGPTVIDGIMEMMREPCSELRIRCCGHALQNAVGRQASVVIAKAELAKFGTDETSPDIKGLRANLGKLVELLESNKPILIMPTNDASGPDSTSGLRLICKATKEKICVGEPLFLQLTL